MDRILEIGDYQIELIDEDIVPVTKSIYDIQEPTKRKSAFTKTIKLPSSRVDLQVFLAYFDAAMYIENNIQFDPFYNPTKKVKAVYYEFSLEIISGYARLVDIKRTNELIEFELLIFGENADIFKSLDGKKMSDLNFDSFNHTYDKVNIVGSWLNTEGYVYPQVSNGRRVDLINFVTNQVTKDYWHVGAFDLWFFVKTLWDKIWEDSGFRYYSEFINTDTFNKLVYKGYSDGMRKTEEAVNDSLVAYSLNDTGNLPYQPNLTWGFLILNNKINFDTLIQDNNSVYNIGFAEIQPTTTAEYNISLESTFEFKNVTGLTIPSGVVITGLIRLLDSNGNTIIDHAISYQLTASLPNLATIQVKVSSLSNNIRLEVGTAYSWVFANNYIGVESKLLNTTFNVITDATYQLNDTIEVSALLGPETTQKDFIMGLVKMFNLYIEPYYFNPSDANSGGYLTYLVEPRDDYYTSEIIDWTKKIDYNKEFTIKPTGAAKEKFYNFTYDLDKDYYNNLYNQRTGRIFGDLKIDIQNEFLSGTNEVKIPFSLMINATNTDPNEQILRPLPSDVKDENLGERNDKSKPKIMFYNGLKSCDNWTFGEEVWGGTLTTHNTYPLLSNFDNIDDVDLDLCFGTPNEVYYSNLRSEVIVSNRGLYNVFHRRALTEVNNKNSKILECYVNLTPLDVHNLSFRPIYEIDGNHYRLYEMIDYNGKDTTKCIFLKLDITSQLTKVVSTTNGGRGSGDWGDNPHIVIEKGNIDTRGNTLITNKKYVLNGGGIVKVPSDIDNVVMLRYRVIETSTDMILTGGEGSPLFLKVDTSAGNVDIFLPPELGNTGKVIHINKIEATHLINVYEADGDLIDTISAITTNDYII